MKLGKVQLFAFPGLALLLRHLKVASRTARDAPKLKHSEAAIASSPSP